MTVAALFVERGGTYYSLPGIDPWDESRDARQYRGPHPVVAHPLASVRRWGGVLEHPARSKAWRRFDLPVPQRGRWLRWLTDPGWVTEVSLVAYGHRARKRTWLYYVGSVEPPELDWSEPVAEACVGGLRNNCKRPTNGRQRVWPKEASATPVAFRDVLLEMARGCGGAL